MSDFGGPEGVWILDFGFAVADCGFDAVADFGVRTLGWGGAAGAARLRAGFGLPLASATFGFAAWVVLRGIYWVFRILLEVSIVSKERA